MCNDLFLKIKKDKKALEHLSRLNLSRLPGVN